MIFAIFLREIKSKFSDKLGIAWSVVSPLAFIMVLTLMRSSVDDGKTHGLPTFFFMVYGILLVQFFMISVSNIAGSLKRNKSLFAFRQVKPIAAVTAVAVFELLSKIILSLVIFLIAYFLKIEINIDNGIGLAYAIFCVWLLSISFGLIFAIVSAFIPEIDKLRSLMLRPLLFVSAVFFSLRDIPQEFWHFLDWNPILHAIEYARFFAYAAYGEIGISFTYLNASVYALLFISSCIYYTSWRMAISR